MANLCIVMYFLMYSCVFQWASHHNTATIRGRGNISSDSDCYYCAGRGGDFMSLMIGGVLDKYCGFCGRDG